MCAEVAAAGGWPASSSAHYSLKNPTLLSLPRGSGAPTSTSVRPDHSATVAWPAQPGASQGLMANVSQLRAIRARALPAGIACKQRGLGQFTLSAPSCIATQSVIIKGGCLWRPSGPEVVLRAKRWFALKFRVRRARCQSALVLLKRSHMP